ncbi:hypothetical protein MKJ04_07290 [Pontibacter sp. E15-1]|uniref:hypothetical protein n=1 Tax=Pontibacter sp. E15-1 TaxID=2919918 RepID=UPI001F4FF5FB|nr:hypothetical protein [Pontibacter sp. E15-1]MCJ8164645.1 hypothetical protein [Pontibacter sp. E15-1]
MKKHLKLSDIPKHNIHRVPDGYFDRLPRRIMERTAMQEEVAGIPAWLAHLSRPLRFAVAPLLLLFVFVGAYLFGTQQASQQMDFSIAALTNTEIMDYLDLYAQVETSDMEEFVDLNQNLTAEFLNVSPSAAEEELYYYQLDDLDY